LRAFESRTMIFEGSGVRGVASFTAHRHFDLTAWQLLCEQSLVSLLKSYHALNPISRNSVVVKSRNVPRLCSVSIHSTPRLRRLCEKTRVLDRRYWIQEVVQSLEGIKVRQTSRSSTKVTTTKKSMTSYNHWSWCSTENTENRNLVYHLENSY